MKKFSEYATPVSEALVAESIKEDQKADSLKFLTLLEKYKVKDFASLNEDDQISFINDLKS